MKSYSDAIRLARGLGLVLAGVIEVGLELEGEEGVLF
jgi:hypothetical protein